ncbi:MAG: O-antigen ligase family protein [Flammeovirgaceae bacterium]
MTLLPHSVSEKLRDQIGYAILLLLFLSQLAPQHISYFITIAFVAFWLVRGGWKKAKATVKTYPIIWLFWGLIFVPIIGLLYTENLRFGRIAIEQKISYVVFPLIIFSSSILSKVQLNRVFGLFSLGWFLLSLASLYFVFLQNQEIYGSLRSESFWLFSHHNLTKPIGKSAIPTALHIGFCMLWLFKELLFNWKRLSTIWRYAYVSLLVYFIGYQVLLASRTIFTSVVIIMYLVTILWFVQQKKIRQALVIAILLPILFLASIYSHNTTWARFTDVLKFGQPMENTRFGGYQLRVEMWKSAWQIIKENPVLGVGTGDAWDVIINVHKQRNFEEGYKNRYHTHNQYIQDLMTLGILGLLILLANLLIPFILAIRHKHYFYGMFLLFIALACTTDITLGFYKGVFFFSFINALLCHQLLATAKDSQLHP